MAPGSIPLSVGDIARVGVQTRCFVRKVDFIPIMLSYATGSYDMYCLPTLSEWIVAHSTEYKLLGFGASKSFLDNFFQDYMKGLSIAGLTESIVVDTTPQFFVSTPIDRYRFYELALYSRSCYISGSLRVLMPAKLDVPCIEDLPLKLVTLPLKSRLLKQTFVNVLVYNLNIQKFCFRVVNGSFFYPIALMSQEYNSKLSVIKKLGEIGLSVEIVDVRKVQKALDMLSHFEVFFVVFTTKLPNSLFAVDKAVYRAIHPGVVDAVVRFMFDT